MWQIQVVSLFACIGHLFVLPSAWRLCCARHRWAGLCGANRLQGSDTLGSSPCSAACRQARRRHHRVQPQFPSARRPDRSRRPGQNQPRRLSQAGHCASGTLLLACLPSQPCRLLACLPTSYRSSVLFSRSDTTTQPQAVLRRSCWSFSFPLSASECSCTDGGPCPLTRLHCHDLLTHRRDIAKSRSHVESARMHEVRSRLFTR